MGGWVIIVNISADIVTYNVNDMLFAISVAFWTFSRYPKNAMPSQYTDYISYYNFQS